jgi:hypothetical protein
MGGEDLILGIQPSGRAMGNLFGHRPRQRSTAGSRAISTEQRRRRIIMVCWVGLALAPLLAGGCEMNNGPSRVLELSALRLNSYVLQSEQPVLVFFYKPG